MNQRNIIHNIFTYFTMAGIYFFIVKFLLISQRQHNKLTDCWTSLKYSWVTSSHNNAQLINFYHHYGAVMVKQTTAECSNASINRNKIYSSCHCCIMQSHFRFQQQHFCKTVMLLLAWAQIRHSAVQWLRRCSVTRRMMLRFQLSPTGVRKAGFCTDTLIKVNRLPLRQTNIQPRRTSWLNLFACSRKISRFTYGHIQTVE